MISNLPSALRAAGRTIALQLLYAVEVNRYVDDGNLLTDDLPTADPAPLAWAHEVLTEFLTNRVAIDAAIDKRLDNWTIHRLAVVDRAILRLGAFEILYRDDVPPKAAINEAIELAKSYGSDQKTTKLINGVLDRLAKEHRPGDLGKQRKA